MHIFVSSDYHNLQSYSSADSLDRAYPIDPFYVNYFQPNQQHQQQQSSSYVNSQLAQVPSRVPSFGHPHPASSSYINSSYEPPPPRPASSMMLPHHHAQNSQHHQPPPYSRVAVSPPPAYKMHSPYRYDAGAPTMPPTDPAALFYSPQQPSYGDQPQQFEPGMTLAQYYQQRKYYQSHLSMAQQGSNQFRSYSPPFDPMTQHALHHFSRNPADSFDFAAIHPLEPPAGPYSHSPMVYATTGRNHHARSSHFHQLGGQHLFNQQPQIPFDLGPYGIATDRGNSSGGRHLKKKKKKKHHSKSRSSSARAHRASLGEDVLGDAEDEEEEDDDEEGDNDEDEVDVDAEHKLKKYRTRHKNRSLQKRSAKTDGRSYVGGTLPSMMKKAKDIEGGCEIESNSQQSSELKSKIEGEVSIKKSNSDSESHILDGGQEPQEDDTDEVVGDEEDDLSNSGIMFYCFNIALPFDCFHLVPSVCLVCVFTRALLELDHQIMCFTLIFYVF